MSKLYKFGYCAICKRQLIVRNIDGWTGKESPHDDLYVCDFCNRNLEKEKKERRENMSDTKNNTL